MNLYIVALFFILLFSYLAFRKRKPERTSLSNADRNKFRSILQEEISFYNTLGAKEQVRFLILLERFLSDVNIEGVGTEISDVDRVMIASSAIIPIFGFPDWKYKNLTNIILYPDTFNNDFQFEGGAREIMGMVGGGYMNGQMLLSRSALTKGFSKIPGKENTGVHEFVHLLDSADGATDGIPDALISHEYAKPWLQMIHNEMHKIESGHSDINPYAVTNEAEFLAVSSEYFFEKPEKFKDKHPELYEQLCLVFNQDPAKVLAPNQGTRT